MSNISLKDVKIINWNIFLGIDNTLFLFYPKPRIVLNEKPI